MSLLLLNLAGGTMLKLDPQEVEQLANAVTLFGRYLERRNVGASFVLEDVRDFVIEAESRDDDAHKRTKRDTAPSTAVPADDLRQDERKLLSQVDAAKELGCNPATIRRMIKRGDITPVMVGSRPRVPMHELDRLLSSGRPRTTE